MTISQWLEVTTRTLPASSSPRLDAELLLCSALGNNRAWILAHDSTTLSPRQRRHVDTLASRRREGFTIAQILHHSSFFGRDFYVNQYVLTPRPESEAFFDCLAAVLSDTSSLSSLIDIGTGSGILAITAKLEYPKLSVTATDISKTALAVAKRNSLTHKTDITLRLQNLLDGDKNEYDIVVANLPYVPVSMRHPSTKHEPSRALYSGADGLNHYRRLFKRLSKRDSTYVLTESLESQHRQLEAIALRSGFALINQRDLVQVYQKI